MMEFFWFILKMCISMLASFGPYAYGVVRFPERRLISIM